MINNKSLKIASSLLFTLALTACGGGGSAATESTSTTTTTTTTPATTDEAQFGLWLNDLADNVVLPGYQHLQTTAEALSSQSDIFCNASNPSNDDLASLQQSWSSFNASWQNIQWIKVGPVLEQSRIFRIELWPDTSDIVDRDLAQVLTEPEITADLFTSKYTGGQGIPALEILLFGSETLLAASDKAKRCEAVQAISENLVNISTDINNAWQSSGDNYVASLKAGTGDFSSQKDAAEELVTNWLEQVESVKDEKLLETIADAAPGNLSIAEFTLANEVIASVLVNIAAFENLYTAGNGHGFDDVLTSHFEQSTISDDISAKIAAINTSLALLNSEMTFEQLLNDEASRTQLTDVVQKIRELRDVITADFVQATDINIGFNSNDGD